MRVADTRQTRRFVHTWYHGVESFKVLVGHAALIAHFIDKAVNEAHHRVGHV